jgi:hypothetical protein
MPATPISATVLRLAGADHARLPMRATPRFLRALCAPSSVPSVLSLLLLLIFNCQLSTVDIPWCFR